MGSSSLEWMVERTYRQDRLRQATLAFQRLLVNTTKKKPRGEIGLWAEGSSKSDGLLLFCLGVVFEHGDEISRRIVESDVLSVSTIGHLQAT